MHERGRPGMADPGRIGSMLVTIMQALGAPLTPTELMPEPMNKNYERRAMQDHDQNYRDQMKQRFEQERATGLRRMLPTRVIADRVMNQGQDMGATDIYPRIDQ